jgi:hypothetical protein
MALLYIYRDIIIKTDNVLKEFPKHSRRLNINVET